MIAIPKPTGNRRRSTPAWQSGFLAMLPKIRQQAWFAFRHLKLEARQDAIQEVISSALVAYVRLVEHGKAALAYPTVLARYGIAQLKNGRRVGSSRNGNEALSRFAQRKHGFVVKPLERFDADDGQWKEAVIEDGSTPVPDQAAFRIDFPAWLAMQSERDRRIAEALAVGHTPSEVAKQFDITPGRVSQLRRQMSRDWSIFHGESIEMATDSQILAAR